MSEPGITVTRQGHVLLMGINRPAKRNAFERQAEHWRRHSTATPQSLSAYVCR